MGTTIAELGNRNRPLDMIVYKKDGKEFLLMSNNSRGVMKIPTDGFADAAEHHQAASADKAGVRLRDGRGDEGRGAARPARRDQHDRARAHRRRRPQPGRRRAALSECAIDVGLRMMRTSRARSSLAALFFFAACGGVGGSAARSRATAAHRAQHRTRRGRRSTSSDVPRAAAARARRHSIRARRGRRSSRRRSAPISRRCSASTRSTDGRVRFTPMFPLDPGRQYHVTFTPPGARADHRDGRPARDGHDADDGGGAGVSDGGRRSRESAAALHPFLGADGHARAGSTTSTCSTSRARR